MNLPTEWSEVPLHKYVSVLEISEVDMDEIDKSIKILSIFSGESEERLTEYPLSLIKKGISKVAFIYTYPENFKGVPARIKLGKKRYVVNPFVNKLTAGEYIDLSELTKDKKQVTKNLHNIIAIFLHPVNLFGKKTKATIETRTNTAKAIEQHLTMDKVFQMSSFFLRNWENLIMGTADCLIKQANKAKKQLMQEIQHSRNIGGGI